MVTDFSIEERISLRKEAGSWLRQKRKSIKSENKFGYLTQQDIAEVLGIESDGYISNIEAGGPSLPESRWREYADILGIPHAVFVKKMLYWYKPDLHIDLYGHSNKTSEIKFNQEAK